MEALKYSVLVVLVGLGLAAGPVGLFLALFTGDWRPLIGVVVFVLTFRALVKW